MFLERKLAWKMRDLRDRKRTKQFQAKSNYSQERDSGLRERKGDSK